METQKQKPSNKKQIIVGLITLVIMIILVSMCTRSCNQAGKNSTVGKSEAYIVAQKFVEAKLISPSTADFPFSYDFCTEYKDSIFVVKGYVDSQNAFGAEIRTMYEITIKYNGGQWNDPRNWTEQHFLAY